MFVFTVILIVPDDAMLVGRHVSPEILIVQLIPSPFASVEVEYMLDALHYTLTPFNLKLLLTIPPRVFVVIEVNVTGVPGHIAPDAMVLMF